jgi:hypothetical protein
VPKGFPLACAKVENLLLAQSRRAAQWRQDAPGRRTVRVAWLFNNNGGARLFDKFSRRWLINLN